MASTWVPPGGFAGAAQQARAVINTMIKRVSSGTPTRRSGGTVGKVRSKRGGKAGARARRATALRQVKSKRGGKAGARARRLVKGSKAAKAYMAKIRKKRKK